MYDNYYYNLDVITGEVIFWSKISKEHPYVINTLVDCLKIEIPEELMGEVMKFTVFFDGVQKEADELIKNDNKEREQMYTYNSDMQTAMDVVTAFKAINDQFLKLLNDVKKYGGENELWQTVLEHIVEEQNYAMMVMDKFQPPEQRQIDINQYQF